MHAKDIQLHLSLLGGRVERCNGAERGGARIGAQDRDVANGKLVAQLRAFGRVREVDWTHLDGDPVVFGEPVRQHPQHIFAPGGDDQVVAAFGELDGQRFADVLRGAGDDSTSVRAWGGYWHGPDRSWADHRQRPPRAAVRARERSQVLAWALWDCGSTGVSAIVVTFVFSVYLTREVGAGLPATPARPAGWAGRWPSPV